MTSTFSPFATILGKPHVSPQDSLTHSLKYVSAAFCALGTDTVVSQTRVALVLMELMFSKGKDNKQK